VNRIDLSFCFGRKTSFSGTFGVAGVGSSTIQQATEANISKQTELSRRNMLKGTAATVALNASPADGPNF
jgi:hypothetical protein